MLKRIRLIGFIAALAVTICLFGCGAREDDGRPRIQVSYWGGYEEVEIIEGIAGKWQEEHPDIKIELQHTPGISNYTNKLLTRVAGGAPPDVSFAEVKVFVDFVTHDLFLDLKPFIEKDPNFDIGDFFPDVVKRFTRDGKILGIPRDTAPFACVYYNKRLFDEAGLEYPTDDWTMEEMLEKAQALTRKDAKGRTVQYGFCSHFFENFIYAYGGRLADSVDNPTKCALSDPKTLKGLQFYTDLYTKYKVSPNPEALSSSGKSANQLFMTGQVAMYNSGVWESPALRDIKNFDWDIVMFPKGPGGRRAFGTGGSAYCILKTTKNPEAAWEVVKALAGNEGQIMMAKKGLAQPANIKIAEGPYWTGDPKKPLNKGMLNEAVEYVVYSPFHPKWREAEDKYIRPELDYLLLGEINAEEFANRVCPKVDKLLNEE